MRIQKDTVIEETSRAGVYRRRRLDLTERWLVDGVIEPELHDAAVMFGLWFDRAHLRDRYSSLRMERVDRSTNTNATDDAIQARKEIRAAMDLLGNSMGPVVWDCIGNSQSLRDYVSRQANTRTNVHEARGRLIAGLDLLARHWKLKNG